MEEKKEKKGYGERLILSLIVAIIVVILFILKFQYEVTGLLSLVGWSRHVLYAAIFFAAFAFSFFLSTFSMKKKEEQQLTEVERKQKKKKRLTVIFILISLFMTGLYISYNYKQLELWGLGKSIPAVALFFGLIFMAFELFSFIRPSVFDGLVRLPWDILMKVIVPMMPFCIILLGVMQAWYPTSYPFLDKTVEALKTSFSVASTAFQKVLVQLYTLGLESPSLWFVLTIGAFIVMSYLVVKNIFVIKELDEEELSADELICKTIEENNEEEKRKAELKGGAKKRWYEKVNDLFTSSKTREKEKQEELRDAKANSRIIKYSLDLRERTR